MEASDSKSSELAERLTVISAGRRAVAIAVQHHVLRGFGLIRQPGALSRRRRGALVLVGAAMAFALLTGSVLAGAGMASQPPVGSSAAETPQVRLNVLIKDLDTDRTVIRLRALSKPGGRSGLFRVSRARIVSIPCPGPHRFKSSGHIIDSGTVTSYTATMRLRKFRARPERQDCGEPLSEDAGRDGAAVTFAGGQERLFRISGKRKTGKDTFKGTLRLNSLPRCDRGYRLLADFRGPATPQHYRYRVRVRRAKATANNEPVPVTGC